MAADLDLKIMPNSLVKEARNGIKEVASPPMLPVVDISGLDGPQHDKTVEAIVKAAKEYGFMQVVNHGMGIEFLEELRDSVRKFFDQPAEKKRAYSKGVSPSPLVTYLMTFAPEDKERLFEWVDILSMTYGNENGDADALKYWPDPCKEVVLKYLKTSMALAKRVVKFALENIGVTPDKSFFETFMAENKINLNYYPPCPEPDFTVGMSRHSDNVTLTVLLQDEVGGLFVRTENDGDALDESEWVEITPIPGALIIMLGDCLEILSNGAYKSPEHWVRTSTKARLSIPVFSSPESTTKIAPLPEVAENDGGPRYKEIVFSEYTARGYTAGPGKGGTVDTLKISQPCEI